MRRYVDNIAIKLLCGHNDCKYTGGIDGRLRYCNYLEIVGHKRPCKPTKNCKCYEKRSTPTNNDDWGFN